MKKIDAFLNNITMYRLVLYALALYSGLGIFLALLGKLSFDATNMIVSLGIVLATAYAVDRVCSRLMRQPSNSESWLITALIIFLIVQPASTPSSFLALALAGAVSSASKFILTWNGKHIFNPAAFAAALLSLTALQSTTWWIGSSIFWPATLVVGLAIVRKIRRFPLVLTFATVSIALQLALFVMHGQPLGAGMKGALVASPLIFLSTVMLTEPATMPPRRNQQIIFATLVAVLYVMAWKVGPLYVYPEVALLIGNLYAFAVSPKFRLRLELREIQRISDQVYNYVFRPERRFAFIPGQYMEWTLDNVPYDSRGNRRTFTIASSPTDENVHLGVKYYQPASTYKATLANLKVGDSMYVSQLAGNFTLDQAPTEKVALIAGGIGITPFRSMITYLMDNQIKRDIILLYVVSHPKELAYHMDFIAAARTLGITYVPIVNSDVPVPAGVVRTKLTQDSLAKLVPDYAERAFYISGPNGMVDATKDHLRELNVPRLHIKTDHFSGY